MGINGIESKAVPLELNWSQNIRLRYLFRFSDTLTKLPELWKLRKAFIRITDVIESDLDLQTPQSNRRILRSTRSTSSLWRRDIDMRNILIQSTFADGATRKTVERKVNYFAYDWVLIFRQQLFDDSDSHFSRVHLLLDDIRACHECEKNRRKTSFDIRSKILTHFPHHRPCARPLLSRQEQNSNKINRLSQWQSLQCGQSKFHDNINENIYFSLTGECERIFISASKFSEKVKLAAIVYRLKPPSLVRGQHVITPAAIKCENCKSKLPKSHRELNLVRNTFIFRIIEFKLSIFFPRDGIIVIISIVKWMNLNPFEVQQTWRRTHRQNYRT